MRARNIALLVCAWFAAYGAYLFIDIAGQLWLFPKPVNRHDAASLVTVLLVHFGGGFVVTALAGAVLCRFVASAVPLNWCLGLGLLYAATHLLPFVFLRPPVPAANLPASAWLFNASIAIGYAIAPVLGGYMVKRRSHHANLR
jgi:hypothetical protein